MVQNNSGYEEVGQASTISHASNIHQAITRVCALDLLGLRKRDGRMRAKFNTALRTGKTIKPQKSMRGAPVLFR